MACGVLGCLLAVGLLGCQGRFPAERIPKMKWLILPLEAPPSMRTTPRAIRGWWFGARTVRQNPRAGPMLADTLNRALARLEFINLYSVIELKYYFADKRQLLEDAYPFLSDDEIIEQIDQIPHIEYAKELGADKLISGRIMKQYLAENRTIHWWWSVLDAECEVTDVQTGQVEWSRRYHVRQQFASQTAVQEELVERLIEDLEKEYFLPMIRH